MHQSWTVTLVFLLLELLPFVCLQFSCPLHNFKTAWHIFMLLVTHNIFQLRKSIKIYFQKKKKLCFFFIFLSFLGFSAIQNIIDLYLLLLYMWIIRTYFPLDWVFKIIYILKKHVYAYFAHVQLCISSFACKLICRHSTLIAKVNSCINFNFCITIIMLYLSKIRGILKNCDSLRQR